MEIHDINQLSDDIILCLQPTRESGDDIIHRRRRLSVCDKQSADTQAKSASVAPPCWLSRSRHITSAATTATATATPTITAAVLTCTTASQWDVSVGGGVLGGGRTEGGGGRGLLTYRDFALQRGRCGRREEKGGGGRGLLTCQGEGGRRRGRSLLTCRDSALLSGEEERGREERGGAEGGAAESVRWG